MFIIVIKHFQIIIIKQFHLLNTKYRALVKKMSTHQSVTEINIMKLM